MPCEWCGPSCPPRKNAALPKDGSAGRRAAGAGVVLGLAVLGFLATAATTAALGAITVM